VKPVSSSISRPRAATPPDRLPSEPSLSAPGDDSAARLGEHRLKRRLSAADSFHVSATRTTQWRRTWTPQRLRR
jgi:hypothetical protein